MILMLQRTCPPEQSNPSVQKPTLCSIDHQLFRVQAFAVCHALEDYLSPDADGEFLCFFFQNLFMEV